MNQVNQVNETAIFMTVTPDQAARWLDNNHDNRAVRAARVDSLKRDMLAGRFMTNGESIKFSVDGRLVDGQHRLLACVASGVPFKGLVVSGIAPETFLTIDTGLQKSFSDLIGPSGERNAVLLAAALRWCVIWDNGKLGLTGSSLTPTSEEMYKFLERTPQIRESVSYAVNERLIGLPPSMAAFLHIAACLNGERDRVELFLTRIKSGENISKQNPELMARKWLIDNAQSKRKARPGYVLGILIKSWNYARAGKTIAHLRIQTGEGFPVLQRPVKR